MNDLRPNAISAGFLLDIVGTALTAVAVVVLTPGLSALPEDQQASFLVTSTTMQIFGALWTVAGGFLAAHLAKDREIANAFAMGAFSTVLGFLSAFTGPSTVPFGYEAVGLAITIPLALLGGWLRKSLRARAVAK